MLIETHVPNREPLSVRGMVAVGILSEANGRLLTDSLARNDNFLIVSPTGSGKSTLAAALANSAGRHRHVITIQQRKDLYLARRNVRPEDSYGAPTDLLLPHLRHPARDGFDLEALRQQVDHARDKPLVILDEVRSTTDWTLISSVPEVQRIATIHARSAVQGLLRASALAGITDGSAGVAGTFSTVLFSARRDGIWGVKVHSLAGYANDRFILKEVSA